METKTNFTAADLKKEIALHLTQQQAAQAVQAAITAIRRALAGGQAVTIRGIGTLRPVQQAQRHGRDFSTGKTVTIPPRTVIKYTPSKELTAKINAQADGEAQ